MNTVYNRRVNKGIKHCFIKDVGNGIAVFIIGTSEQTYSINYDIKTFRKS